MIKGIFPPIITPFEKDEISFDKLKENIAKWNSTKINGYVVLGSNGESAYLTNDEKIDLIKSVKENADEGKAIIAGTGSDSIKQTIELTNKAADVGAEYALILTPFFYNAAMTHEAMLSFFNKVADEIKIPLLIYNVTKFTGINIHPSTVTELAKHENIVGIKNSSENVAELSLFKSSTGEEFSVIAGTASILYPGLCVGADGGILALANIAPNQCAEIYEHCKNDDHDSAKALQAKLVEANRAVTSRFGVAGLKAALEMIGYFGGNPRKPMQPLSETNKTVLKEILMKAEIINS